MTKTFCDRCGREADVWKTKLVTDISGDRTESMMTKCAIDACDQCRDALIDAFGPVPQDRPAPCSACGGSGRKAY